MNILLAFMLGAFTGVTLLCLWALSGPEHVRYHPGKPYRR